MCGGFGGKGRSEEVVLTGKSAGCKRMVSICVKFNGFGVH